MEFEEELAGGVGGALGFGVIEPAQGVAARDFFPQSGREVRHFLQGVDALLPDPIEDLVASVGRFVEFVHEMEELWSGEAMEGIERHGSRSAMARDGQNIQI